MGYLELTRFYFWHIHRPKELRILNRLITALLGDHRELVLDCKVMLIDDLGKYAEKLTKKYCHWQCSKHLEKCLNHYFSLMTKLERKKLSFI